MRKRAANKRYATSREVYKAVKKYDHLQFDEFCTKVYLNGYEDGRNSVPGIDIKEVMKTIADVKGVGPALNGKICAAIENRFGEIMTEEGGEDGCCTK